MEGQVIDIDKARRNAKNRIYRVGIELEGGWKALPRGSDHLHNDSSVRFNPTEVGRSKIEMIGELPSPPLAVGDEDSPIFWKTWVRKFYPHAVNFTCGMHVHMSFQAALTYQRLMTEA